MVCVLCVVIGVLCWCVVVVVNFVWLWPVAYSVPLGVLWCESVGVCFLCGVWGER